MSTFVVYFCHFEFVVSSFSSPTRFCLSFKPKSIPNKSRIDPQSLTKYKLAFSTCESKCEVKTESESMVRHFDLTSLFCCLLFSFLLGTMAANNINAMFDHINDNLEDIK